MHNRRRRTRGNLARMTNGQVLVVILAGAWPAIHRMYWAIPATAAAAAMALAGWRLVRLAAVWLEAGGWVNENEAEVDEVEGATR